MTITTFLNPAQMPLRTQDQTTFDGYMSQFMQSLPTFVSQFNTDVANVNAGLAGGAFGFAFTFDSSTVDADPGTGKLRLSSATQNASTVVRMDTSTAAGVDISQVFALLANGTSTVKGGLRIIKASNPAQWMLLQVNSVAMPTGYRNLTGVVVASSATNPFTNGDSLIVYVDLAGDIGTSTSLIQIATPTVVASSVAQIDYLNTFNGNYDKYIVEVQGLTPSAAAALTMRLGVAGAVDASASYTPFTGNGVVSAGGSPSTNIQLPGASIGNSGINVTLEVLNANAASAYKTVTGVGSALDASNGISGIAGAACYLSNNAVSGFRLFFSGGASIIRGTVRVFGVRNSLT